MIDSLYIAVDLGAGSGRVFLAGASPGELLLEELRRFHYPPAQSNGHLRWDLSRIFAEIKRGAHEGGEKARALGRVIQSIGLDSWGVDYGLIDRSGRLVEDPICYRDQRTQGMIDQVIAQVPRGEIYERTGIQFLELNTLFQLYAHTRSGIPGPAVRLLQIPDLINFFLSGRAVSEYTNATTTQLVNAHTHAWDGELIEHLHLPARLFAEIVPAGTNLGPLQTTIAAELELQNVEVVAPATHDTGSAVAGTPLEEGWAYISSGTWSLVGVERDGVLINDEVARHNFTNEGGAFGTIRFLKNVMGLWILEACRKEWQESGVAVDYGGLLGRVAALDDYPGFIFPDDQRFFNPSSMLAALATQLNESGQEVPVEPARVAKIILDSLAFRYASVLRLIETLTGQALKGVHIIGGGSQNAYLNQATANATGLTVLAGPSEATVMGNLLVQAISAGRFASLNEARAYLKNNIRLQQFVPQPSVSGADAKRRYAAIE
ncbi:MAG TPA: rhamnulokinase family protein, partial [Pyrinomonadaceae bacterium]|nr:rhamnulokinase family protein [Pyrinomonadaceae bacterium]